MPPRSCAVLVTVLAVLVVASVTACGGTNAEACPGGQPKLVQERTVDVAYRRLSAERLPGTDPKASGLVLEVGNTQRSVERVRVSFDGENALDIDVPAVDTCGRNSDSVFSMLYERAPGPVEVVLDLQGATSTSTIEVPAHGLIWAVVDVQKKRAWGDITVYEERPMRG